MTRTIILPGIGGSGEAHWQSRWERSTPSMRRFQPSSWDAPILEDWLVALDAAISETPEPPFLVAHSLACLLVAHWSARRPGASLKGVFLVAPPDPRGPDFPAEAAGTFRDVPDQPLSFPSLIVASEDDPYGPLAYCRARAEAWGAGLVVAGRLGHINAASGLGDWSFGRMLFEAFRAGAGG